MAWYRKLKLANVLAKTAKIIGLDEVSEENLNGNCFEVSARYVVDSKLFGDRDFELVHGAVTGQGPISGINYSHAWIEDGDFVIDLSNNKSVKLPKFLYYAMGRINEVVKYSPEEARKNMLKYKHYGPWK